MISEYFPQVPPAYGKAEVAEVSAMEQKAEVAKDCDSRVDKQPEVAPCGCPTVNVCMLWRVLQAHLPCQVYIPTLYNDMLYNVQTVYL